LLPAALLAGLAARIASADAVVLAAITIVGAALVHLAAEADPRPRALRTLAFWGGLASVILAGGWLATAVAIPMIVALPLVDRSFRRLQALDPARGAGLLAVLLVPTTVALLVRGFEAGWPGIDGLVAWFAAPDPGRFAPPGTHLVLALATVWPLSALVPLLLAAPRDRQPDVPRRRVRIVLAAWVLPAWLLIEILPDKRPLDVLPLLPPLAILVGLVLAASPLPSGRLSARVAFALLAAGAVLLCFALNAGFVLAAGHASAVGLAGAAVATAAAFAAVWLLLRGRLTAALPLVLFAAGVVAWLAFDSLAAATQAAWTIWFS
jgi:4-amino-4-deoxy-L-arabinose transferase-like glycosyltransferase